MKRLKAQSAELAGGCQPLDRLHLMRVAELAGQLTHDLGNALGAIAIESERMKLERSRDPWLDRGLDAILDSTGKAMGLLALLREVAERRTQVARSTDLNRLIEELLPTLRSLCGEAVRLEIALDDQLPPVAARRPQLAQLLLSLLLHARSALVDARGTLQLRTLRSAAAGGEGAVAACLEVVLVLPSQAGETAMGHLLLPFAPGAIPRAIDGVSRS